MVHILKGVPEYIFYLSTEGLFDYNLSEWEVEKRIPMNSNCTRYANLITTLKLQIHIFAQEHCVIHAIENAFASLSSDLRHCF